MVSSSAQDCAPSIQVFCEEVPRQVGYSRVFIAATRAAMWSRYRRSRILQRHFYEVLRAGRPCHLHFDVDIKLDLNNEIDGEAMTSALLSSTDAEMRSDGCAVNHVWIPLPIALMSTLTNCSTGKYSEWEPTIVLELDSTTAKQFSRHITIRTPGWAFQNNAAVGKFVPAMAINRPGDWIQAVDMSVYSRSVANCCH